jgi:hypothetical protein
MSLSWGLLPPRTVNGVRQDGYFAYATAANGKTYEIWPVADPADITEVWALTLGDAGRSDDSDGDGSEENEGDDSDENDSGDSEDLGRFNDFEKAQLAAELHDIAHPPDTTTTS